MNVAGRIIAGTRRRSGGFVGGVGEAPEIGEDGLADLLALLGERMVGGEGLAGAGVEPDGGPILGPATLGVDVSVGGEATTIRIAGKAGDDGTAVVVPVPVPEGVRYDTTVTE